MGSWWAETSKYEPLSYFTNLTFEILVNLFKRLGYPLTFVKNTLFSVRIKNGPAIYFPFRDISRFNSLFSFLPSESYFKDFEKYFKWKFSLKKKDIVLDIGAHVGRFSLPLIYTNRNIKIISFEPDIENYKSLVKSKKENGLGDGYKIFNQAVLNREGKVDFSTGEKTTQGSVSSVGFFMDRNKKNIPVKCTSLKKIFKENKIKQCRLVKMDCEGSEYLILKSTPKNIFKRIDIIFIEAHVTSTNDPVSIRELLIKAGFVVKGSKTSPNTSEYYAVNRRFAKCLGII